MKWHLFEIVKPKNNQYCYAVFNHEGSTNVWLCQYVDGSFIGWENPGTEECHDLVNDPICWVPEPENPFHEEY